MSFSLAVDALGKLMSVVRNHLGYVRATELAAIDVDLLRLKHGEVHDALDHFKEEAKALCVQEIADLTQDMISRGLSNSTVLTSQRDAIDRKWYERVQSAEKEVTRFDEEVALTKKRIKREAT